MNIKLYRFAKRTNSTAQPVESGANPTPSLSLTGAKINDGNTSILNPEITLPDRAQIDQVQLSQFNYAYIPLFARYYHINNWSFNGDGTWTAYCSVDVLASWKTNILSSGGYVQRSYTSMETADIADPLYPATNTFVTNYEDGFTGLKGNPAQGTFVVGILSSQAPNVGAVSYYIVTSAQMAVLVSAMMATSSGDAWADITLQSETAMKSIIDPLQYVVSCKWFPFVPDSGISYTDDIYFGSWATTAKGHKLSVSSGYYQTAHLVISSQNEQIQFIEGGLTYNWGYWSYIRLPYLAEESTDGYYPLFDQYANCSLVTPWGVFDMPTPVIHNLNKHASTNSRAKLYYRIRADLISGEGTFWVVARPYKGTTSDLDAPITILKRNVMVAKDIPLVQVTINNAALSQGALTMAGQVMPAIGGLLVGDVSGVAALGKSIVQFDVDAHKPSVKSTACGTTSITQDIEMLSYEETRYKTIPLARELTGTLRKAYVSSLSGFTGYLQMDVTTFAASCTGTEKDEILSFLSNGVYIE